MSTNPEYIYSEESESFSFFRIPRALVKDERFRNLSIDSKLLYSLMLDRMGLSLQYGWQDTEGRAFIYFTLEEIQATLVCGHNKAVRLLAELEQYALIERVKQGQGKPAKIYVKKISAADTDSGEDTENDSIFLEPADLKRSEKPTCSPPVLKRLDFPKGDIILIRTILSSAISIHPSILTADSRLHRHHHHAHPATEPSITQLAWCLFSTVVQLYQLVHKCTVVRKEHILALDSKVGIQYSDICLFDFASDIGCINIGF